MVEEDVLDDIDIDYIITYYNGKLFFVADNEIHGDELYCHIPENIYDDEAPTARCKDYTVLLDGNGQANIIWQ